LLRLNRDTRLAVLTEVLVGSAYGLWQYILPIHIRDLGATPAQVGLALSASGVTMLLTHLPMGLMADRLSRRRLMIACCAAPVLPTAMLSLATRWEHVLVLLCLVYVQTSMLTVLLSYLAHVNPKEDLSRIFAVVSFGWISGGLVFRYVGARIAAVAGMQVVFVVSALFFLLSVLVISRVADLPRTGNSGSVDYRPLLNNRAFRALLAYTLAAVVCLSVGPTLLPNYLEDVAGLDLAAVGRAGTIAGLGAAVLNLILGRLRGRLGLLIVLLGMLTGVGIVLGMPSGAPLVVGLFLFGCYQVAFPFIEGATGRLVSLDLAGLAYAVQLSLEGVGFAIAAPLAGLLYEAEPGQPLVFSFVAIAVLIPFTASLRLPVSPQSRQTQPDGMPGPR